MTHSAVLDDLVELIGGGTPKTTFAEFWGGNIPWLSVADFSGDNRWVDSTEKHITPLGLENSSTRLLKEGDIIISARGTVGELAQLSRPMALNQSCYGIRAKPGVDQDYLYYLLKYSINGLRRQAHGGVFSTITRETFKRVPVNLPPVEVQQKTADILGAIDKKIKVNRKMNETLEQMGQAIFRHYFIDNPTPQTWGIKPLDGIAHFLNGLAMQKYPRVDGEPTLPVIKIREMSAGITPNTDIASANIPPQYIVHSGDLLFSWSGTLMVKFWTGSAGALNQHLFKVTSGDYPEWLYYYWTRHYLDDFVLTAKSKATTMGHIQRRHLAAAKVLIPDDEDMKKIGEQIQPLVDQCKLCSEQIQTLRTLRDQLLPCLMSGELQV